MVVARLVFGVAALAGFATISSVSAAPAGDSLEVPDNGREKAPFNGINREPCYYEQGKDIPGHDVGNKPATSFRDCDNFCFQTDKCVTWSWNKWNGGTCWLKSYHDGTVDNGGAISLSCSLEKYAATTEVPWPQREKAPFDGVNREPCFYDVDTDRPGYDLSNKPASSFRDCNGLCYAEKGCLTWAWNDYKGGTCWLKTRNGGSVTKVGAVSLSCSIERHGTKRAIKSHDANKHHKVSVKVHDGNVTIKISTDHHSSGQKRITEVQEKSSYRGIHGEYCQYWRDSDNPGFDVGNKPAKEFKECDDICMSFKGCATWSWNNHNGGTCWLKSHIGGGGENTPGTVSLGCEFDKNDPLGICLAYPDIDFVGNDIGNKPGRHDGECCAICDKTQGCSAFAWNNDNGGTCYLKSSVGHVVAKAGVVSSSQKPLNGPVCPFEYDTDYAGNDIGNKPAKDAGVCCSACKESKDCKAYTWSNHNGGTCWMKSGKGKATKAAGVISATLFAPLMI